MNKLDEPWKDGSPVVVERTWLLTDLMNPKQDTGDGIPCFECKHEDAPEDFPRCVKCDCRPSGFEERE